MHYCNNSAVAGATSRPTGEDVVHDLSVRQPRDISNKIANVQSADKELRQTVIERSIRRRRQAIMVNVDDSNINDIISYINKYYHNNKCNDF